MKSTQQQIKRQFQQHLQQQQLSRQAKLEQKKLQQLQQKNPEEHMLYIHKQFKNKSQTIDAAVKKYKQKAIQFGELMSLYQKTKDYYVSVSYALKTYDRQSYKEQLDKIHNTIIDLKKKNQPRKKFKFSRRQQDFGVKAQNIVQESHVKQSQIDNIPGIQNRSNQQITIPRPPTDHNPTSYKIINCTSCTIDLLQPTQILFLKNLTQCTIRAALAKSTVFVDNCNKCTLELNCHQLRIHNTFDTTFRIFVTSKAIIEDCDRVVFGPYRWQYQGKENDQQAFERVGKENLWREIQDFNWLKENIKSPHYQLVEQ